MVIYSSFACVTVFCSSGICEFSAEWWLATQFSWFHHIIPLWVHSPDWEMLESRSSKEANSQQGSGQTPQNPSSTGFSPTGCEGWFQWNQIEGQRRRVHCPSINIGLGKKISSLGTLCWRKGEWSCFKRGRLHWIGCWSGRVWEGVGSLAVIGCGYWESCFFGRIFSKLGSACEEIINGLRQNWVALFP